MKNRFQQFLLWLGYPRGIIQDTKITQFCKTVSEFALEYRTACERIATQKAKKKSRGERKKTRGILISNVRHFSSELVHRSFSFDFVSGDDRKKSNDPENVGQRFRH